MLKTSFYFFTKYITLCVIVSSFLAAIYGIIFLDLDSMLYAEFSESLRQL